MASYFVEPHTEQFRKIEGSVSRTFAILNFMGCSPHSFSIGHRNAVAVIYGVKLSGFLAWFLWRGIYLAKLPTFRRKLEVALSWACDIPFPPNIVQLRLSKKQSAETDGDTAETKNEHPERT